MYSSKKKFRFKKWWMERSDFKEMVLKAWNKGWHLKNPMDVWQFKIRTFRRLVRGWTNNVVAEMNETKHIIAAEYNLLDCEAESRVMDSDEVTRMK
jgi:hypothetical protein